jgi:hypothetical protein
LIAVAREVTNVEFMRGTLRSIVAAWKKLCSRSK